MAKVSPIFQLALLDQLGLVDGKEFLRGSEGDSTTPEQIPPSGVGDTTRDTGSPSNFVERFRSADLQSQILTGGGILLALFGLVAVARKFI